ncbi:hypothetical protein [Chryseobacterium sp. MFBS3-17]|uniref:hypothetical protein n=1 Tax=Chryseobacterium sp. MFBS3-17 TaxID=2886689 RepID=UPI001D0E5638|nr:hypothetical protein [Chryseobacterium sp. MFBS3-17]MCC2591260.1 hypothetical protein [Chryseobacterium sp. MFBS3-17]
MKFSFKIFMALIVMSAIMLSCRSTEDPKIPETNGLQNLLKVQEITNSTHAIELYTVRGTFQTGYNDITLRIRNLSNNQYEANANITWTPRMHMTSMTHSCPRSAITPSATSLYHGYIVFQMPQNNTEYWDLTLDYVLNGVAYTATAPITVQPVQRKNVNAVLGADGQRYVIAHIEPSSPKVAINNWTVGIWKMQDMMTFPVANGLKLKLDPRMPGMGNHSSPNNEDAIQSQTNGFYQGKVSLTMTGYWKLNLQLLAADGSILKGEAVTDIHPESSLFFELEF